MCICKFSSPGEKNPILIQDTFKLLFLFVFEDMHNSPYLLGINIFSSVSSVQTIVENSDKRPLQPDQALKAG